jgi:putative endonuclease
MAGVPTVPSNIEASIGRYRPTRVTIRKFQYGKRRRAFVFYVCILRSKNFPDQTYVGSTSDLRKRLAEHNSGKSIHTNEFKPWELAAYFARPEKQLAEQFEGYLKSGSGRAFAKRHLLMQNEPKSWSNMQPQPCFAWMGHPEVQNRPKPGAPGKRA